MGLLRGELPTQDEIFAVAYETAVEIFLRLFAL